MTETNVNIVETKFSLATEYERTHNKDAAKHKYAVVFDYSNVSRSRLVTQLSSRSLNLVLQQAISAYTRLSAKESEQEDADAIFAQRHKDVQKWRADKLREHNDNKIHLTFAEAMQAFRRKTVVVVQKSASEMIEEMTDVAEMQAAIARLQAKMSEATNN